MKSTISSISCAPRIATPRTDRRIRGHEVAKIAELLGKPFLPWQRLVADTALELTDGGRFAYREVVLTVPRQSGKSALLCALMVWRALAFGKHQRVAYTAQTGKDATEKLLDEFAPIILDSPIANTVERVYKKAGAPSVVFRNGSRIIALPSSETTG